MFNKIVVPLDGSTLSEKALPYATMLAKQLKAGLTLLTVTEWPLPAPTNSRLPVQEAPSTAYQAQAQSNTIQLVKIDDVEAYLQQVKTRLISPDAAFPLLDEQVKTRVVYSKSPKELAGLIKQEDGKLVVMTTHGRSGLSLLMAGSIATNIIQHSTIPVILIKPSDSRDAIATPAETTAPIVVTLDGSAASEAILVAASSLALQLGVKLHLLEVVYATIPDAGGQLYIPVYYDLEIEASQLKARAEEYLKDIQLGLQARGIDCTTTVITGVPVMAAVYNSELAFKIAEYAQMVNAQLVAMATHAHGRFGQVLLGSVAEEEVRENQLPVMLVRIPEHGKHES